MTTLAEHKSKNAIINNGVSKKDIHQIANKIFKHGKDVTIDVIEHFDKLLPVGESAGDTNQYFGRNLVVRSYFFPAGTIATGRVQKYDHVSIMVSGHMTIWTPDKGVHDVHGPDITEVKAGMKRMGFAHTDTLWCTAIAIPENIRGGTLDDITESVTFGTYNEFLRFKEIIDGNATYQIGNIRQSIQCNS